LSKHLSRNNVRTTPRKGPLRQKTSIEKKRSEKKKGSTTNWGLVIAGIIIFIIGIDISFTFWGQMFYPMFGFILNFIGVYIVYKGLTHRHKDTPIDKDIKNSVLLFVAFWIFFLPVMFSFLQLDSITTQTYSVTNTSGTGCSEFREMLESQGYETKILLSSYNELQRSTKYHPTQSTLLVVLGPKKMFSIFEVASLIDFLKNGGKMFIACDFGTVNELAISASLGMALANFSISFVQYSKYYLCEQGSGYNFNVVTDVGIIRIYRGTCIQSVAGGTAYLNTLTSSNTWLDKNNNGVYDSATEEMKSYPLAVKSGNIIYFSDVELFTNQHIDAPGYSHRAFASYIINDLTGGDRNYLIVFDEAHQIKNAFNSSYIFGYLLSYINFFQFYWALLPIGIYLIYKVINRFIPNIKKEIKKDLKKRFKTIKKALKKQETGSVYFAKLIWFKRLGKYRDAANLLYNRLKRNLMRKLKLNSWDLDRVIDGIVDAHVEEENFDERRLIRTFEKLERLANKEDNITNEKDFLNVFLSMKWISEQL